LKRTFLENVAMPPVAIGAHALRCGRT